MKKYLIIIIFLIIIIPTNVKGLISFDCANYIESYQELRCNIEASENIVAFGALIRVQPNLTISNIVPRNNFINHSMPYGNGTAFIFEHATGARQMADFRVNILGSTPLSVTLIVTEVEFVLASSPEVLFYSENTYEITVFNISLPNNPGIIIPLPPTSEPVDDNPPTNDRTTTRRPATIRPNNEETDNNRVPANRVFITSLKI